MGIIYVKEFTGGGPLLVLLALQAESAFTIGNILNSLEDNILYSSFSDFRTNGDIKIRTDIVQHLVWILDINNLLAKYNTIREASKENNDLQQDITDYNINISSLNRIII